jgi:hypothetical protein
MRELIRHILKENRVQQELKQVIKDGNIFDAADLVGGMDILKNILKDDPEMSSLFEKLTGTITFDYYVNKDQNIEFPLDYEIIGRKSNNHKTNHWPEINVLYDENKLTPEENDTFRSMVKNLADDAQHSGFKSKFNDGRIFNANYLTVVELNGENIDSIWGGHYPWPYEVEEIHDKLYGNTESLNESTVPSQVKRRQQIFDDMFLSKRNRLISCDYRTPEYLFNGILELTLEELYFGWFVDSVTYEEWEESIKYIESYLTKKYYNETSQMWESKCKGKRINETEQNVSKKINIASNIIENEFSDVVRSIDVVEYFDTPTIIVKVETDDSAANVTIWLTEEMINTVSEITSGKVKLDYWFTGNKESEILLRVKKINGNNKLTESEHKQPKYLNIIKDLVEPFKDEDGVCDIRVSYDDDDDMYSVYIVMGTEEMNDKFFYVPMIQSHISKLRINVRNTIKDYLPIDNLYVGSYGKPNCKWDSINESSIKEKSLINIIENEGLYDFIEMTGIDFNEVRSLLKHVDNPKEILKQYIREFVLEKGGVSGENYGSLFGLEAPLSNTKYVEDILVYDDESIAVEMWEYHLDEYGHREQKDQYLTTINNLTNDELLTIVAWMMETLKGNYWD